MAVMNKKSGAHPTLGAQAHKHHVEAENLHVLDTLAAFTLPSEI